MPSIEKEPMYDVYFISGRQYQRFLNILFGDVSVAQLVASTSGVVLGGVVMVVGSNLARGKIFTASIGSVDSLYIISLSFSLFLYIYIYIQFFNILAIILNEQVSLLKGLHCLIFKERTFTLQYILAH